VEFFRQAAQYGDLHVAVGSDHTVYGLKGRKPVNSEEERLFMIKAVSYVKDAFISQGSGILDFETELREMIATWCGYQRAAGQSDSVIMMRFWHTFGISVVQAKALGRPEAEALNERIYERIK